jgi:hypothetical protein
MHAALKLSRPDLAKELAKRKKARVENSVADRNAKDLLVHLYACVTLCGGLSCDEATTVAEREFAAQDAPPKISPPCSASETRFLR